MERKYLYFVTPLFSDVLILSPLKYVPKLANMQTSRGLETLLTVHRPRMKNHFRAHVRPKVIEQFTSFLRTVGSYIWLQHILGC